MRDWELVDSDRFSFEDSDRFEEDSLCSWISEPESLCNNWRGWKKSMFSPPTVPSLPAIAPQAKKGEGGSLSLVELSARCVASHIPFEMVERFYPPVPEQLQLRIAFWSFPEHEEDIRLYSCLANGSAEEFQKGERLFRNDSVSDILQIGFHLSATVKPNMREAHKVAVTFDRRRVTSCTCTCNASTNWCGHVVSVCLHRIFQSKDVMLRAPVSESLSRLHRDQLQKFAQYLISELPQQILPTAQRLLDELLSSQRSAINTLRGAPDPTAGASANEQTSWFLDERTLHGNIHKILIKFCVPAPIVFSDVNYLSNAAPPASAEWSSLLRPLRGREPEGMWNLLSIVREMFRREDRNGVPLLEVITEECLNCDQILVWWFNTKVALHNGNSGHGGKHNNNVHSNSHACQHAGSSLCDEIVFLWRLAALNPGLSPDERLTLHTQFKEWHLKIIEKVSKSRNASVGSKHANSFKNDVEVFSGFRPSIEACYLNWDNYPIASVTYSEANPMYHCPFMCFRHSDGHSRSGETGMIHSSHAILNNPAGEHHLLHSSATISSVPILSKRPRSVDFAAASNASAVHPETTKTSPSLSTLKPHGKSGGKRKGKNNGGESSASSLPSASGLKIKNSEMVANPNIADCGSSLEKSSSFEDEIPVAGPSRAMGLGVGIVTPRRRPSDGNRSSVSSEGFCDEGLDSEDALVLKDECIPKALLPPPLNTSDELDGEADLELEDSDNSSLSAQPVFPEIPQRPQPAKFDSSDSQQSGDEYQLYYYDPKAQVNGKREGGEDGGKKDPLALNIFVNLKRIEDIWEVYFARAEGLHAHGHSKEACKLGVKLAQELLANPPDLTIELPTVTAGKGKRKKLNPASHQISCLASATLSKCGFLCTVLAENPEYFYLAFQVGMFGLELARPPASTKPLEVKLANQEAELAMLLKRIPIGQKELDMIRQKAEALKNGTFKSRGDALLPLVLANFIFDALVMPSNREGRCSLQNDVFHSPTDECLGFEAAVAALGLKANISEADHPLLCEGTRRQRGELALSMLLHYKDEADKLAKVMDKLLDREIHQLYKAPLPPAYYSNNPPTTTLLGTSWQWKGEQDAATPSTSSASVPAIQQDQNGASSHGNHSNNYSHGSNSNHGSSTHGNSNHGSNHVNNSNHGNNHGNNGQHSNNGQQEQNQTAGPSTSTSSPPQVNGNSRPQSSTSTEGDVGVAGANGGPTNGNSNSSPTTTSVNNSGSSRSSKESGRYKGKRSYPVLPNQPSEAGAHFMFEMAKVVLGKAGGSSNQSLFTQPSNGQNPRGPHRALHMCAFHIGLYGLGLHNAVSPNWLSRTYSSHVSWITGQAMEIGAPAISFLIDTWDSHLTPPEAVTIADRASRGDANMVRAAAELALSCLPFAHALNPNEIHRAILQCKEQSDGMLEKACVTVESAAKGGGVYPEVLFDVARQWFSLYQKHLPLGVDVLSDEMAHHDQLLSLEESMSCHGMINAQTGLPSVNPNNPPPPPSSSGGGTPVSQMPEMLGLIPTPNGPPPINGYSQQVPMASLPYTTAPYGQVPFIPATFNPSIGPGNFLFGQTVIYQASTTPGVQTTNSGYYNQQNQGNGGGPLQPNYSNGPPIHHSSIVTAGPSLQYYPIGPGGPPGGPGQQHIRQNGGFYPLLHPGGPNHHHMHHQVPTSGPSHYPNQQQQCDRPPVHMNPGNGNDRPFISDHVRNYMRQDGRPPGQPQVVLMNCGGNVMNGHGGGFVQGPRDCMQQGGQSAIKVKYLLAAYRVGMLAMETLARRVHDDRPAAKFARNPTYGEDVKWLLSISRKLGAQYLQQFCICAVSSISNPFVLHEIILDAALISSRNNLAFVYQNPRSPLSPLVSKCQQMYFQCLHQKLYHITLSDYEDFVSIVCTARQAFTLTPDGGSQFKEWLQNLRRSKACKKDLWTQITAALQANPK